jgi:predicted Zn finger-like uncharacterized protein
MKLICPECSADFEVPDEVLATGGRRVRCAHCRHIWFQEAPRPQASWEESPDSFRRFEETGQVDPIPHSLHPDSEDDDGNEEKEESFFATLNYGYLAKMMAGFAIGIFIAGGAMWVLFR